jgi:hypothetical protein
MEMNYRQAANWLIIILLVHKPHSKNATTEFRGVSIATVDNIDWPSRNFNADS